MDFNTYTISSEKMSSISIVELNFSFELKRVYTIANVKKDTIRGLHAHKNLEQVAWCPYGVIEITLNDTTNIRKIVLDTPEKAIFIGPGVWREMKWLKSNSVLCVAASKHYDEDDYVRDYEKFLKMVNEGYWNEK